LDAEADEKIPEAAPYVFLHSSRTVIIMLTKEQVLDLLEKSDKAVARALVVLYERQTESERSSDSTNTHNNRGFGHAHAFMGCRMAKFFLSRGFLTPKQIAYWRKSTPKRGMRLGMYWKQLAEAAQEKALKNQGLPK
jgi:hypothetical protein